MSPEFVQMFTLVALGLFGAAVGSFLNVVIYRVPRGLSINQPKRSFCPSCKKQLRVWHNLPVISWLLLGGKCYFCRSKISSRYFWVELLTAGLFVAMGYRVGAEGGQWLLLLGLCIWLALLVAIVFIDLEHMIIPFSLSGSGMVVGLLVGLWVPDWLGGSLWWEGLLRALLGLVAGWGGIWLVVELGKRVFGKKKVDCTDGGQWMLREPETDEDELCLVIDGEAFEWSDLFTRDSDRVVLSGATLRVDGKKVKSGEVSLYFEKVVYAGGERSIESLKSLSGTAEAVVIPREAMGIGDAHLMGMVGALLGWQSVIFTVFVGSVCGLLVAVVGRLGFGSRIPFGPCLAIGALVWIFGGDRLWDWYLQLPEQLMPPPEMEMPPQFEGVQEFGAERP